MLQAEWMRVCDEQPMPRIDTSRYQLDAPPQAKQADPVAWRRAVENAEAQLEHQANRCAATPRARAPGLHAGANPEGPRPRQWSPPQRVHAEGNFSPATDDAPVCEGRLRISET